MKTIRSTSGERGLTMVEFVVVLFSLFILAIVLLPALSAPRIQNAIGCISQLKRTGSAVSVWEGDHADKYLAATSAINGIGIAENLFETMSNELRSPKVLVCPADRNRLPASSFRTLTSRNLSYFVNLDANEANPQDIMTGDDNLTIRGVRVKSGLLLISNNVSFGWTADRHRLWGNLGMADGSVQAATASGLSNYFSNSIPSTNRFWMRLAIP